MLLVVIALRDGTWGPAYLTRNGDDGPREKGAGAAPRSIDSEETHACCRPSHDLAQIIGCTGLEQHTNKEIPE